MKPVDSKFWKLIHEGNYLKVWEHANGKSVLVAEWFPYSTTKSVSWSWKMSILVIPE